MAAKIRVFVVDSHPATCVGILAILDKVDDLQIMGEAYDLQHLDALPTKNLPDVFLIAANLAADSLFEQVATWKEQFANSKLLIMLTQADECCLRQLTEYGADGAILKTEPTDKLVQAIRAVAQGEPWFSQPLWQELIQPEGTGSGFTEAEKALLPFIVTEMSTREIALALHLSLRTVDRRLEAIYQKLGVTRRIGAVIQLIKRGLA